MTEKEKAEAKERQLARREYDREYRKKNREKLKAYKKEWNATNKDKVEASRQRYWEKKYSEIDVNTEKPDNKVDGL